MKLNNFLKEHGIKIENFGTEDEPTYVLIRISDGKKISPESSMKDVIVYWMQHNTNEIYFKLYTEED